MMTRLLLLVAAAATMACQLRGASADGVAKVPSRELFVLPESYEGPFIAIYDQRDAELPRWTGDTAVFAVPSNGIVRIAYPEPPRGTRTAFVFVGGKRMRLRNYPTCADMRVAVADSLSAVCWLDFQGGGTGIPDHIVAVVTKWERIPLNFERTTVVYDSVLFGAQGHFRQKWEEPRDLKRKK
jgi:hypothetical protein